MINEGIYDMLMRTKNYPFLESHLPHMGLLNYHPISEVMTDEVICFDMIENVGTLYNTLRSNGHNGFPIISREGHLKGFIMRKALCSLLKYRVFASTEEMTKTRNTFSYDL